MYEVNMICSLKWKNFESHQTSSSANMFLENNFFDVTLVSEDQKPFQAHRYILSVFSPVLKDILIKNPHNNPIIYLRGVSHQALSSILEYIYLGKTSVNHRNLKKFAEVVEELEMKNLAKKISKGNIFLTNVLGMSS